MKNTASTGCPVCNAPAYFKIPRPDSPIYECSDQSCQLVFIATQPSDEKLTDLYNQLYYPESQLAEIQKPESDAAKLSQYANHLENLIGVKNKSVLDVGCGTGNFMRALQQLRPSSISGIEPNQTAREIADANGFDVSANIEGLPDNQFDLVVLNDVLEHFRAPLADCQLLWQKLKPGGVIFIATINLGGLKARIKKENWDMITDPTHFYFFTNTSLENLLTHAGFCDVQIDQTYIRFSHHGFLRAFIQRGLVYFGLDSSLKVLGRKPEEHGF